MQRKFTCIVCPLGCDLTVEIDGREVKSVSGNTCPRGKNYAENECTHPVRIVTSVVRSKSGIMVPVKTLRAIPKEKMFDVINILNKTFPELPISSGDVIIEDVFGSPVIATKSVR
jgi:CxxC motif-containing protein